MKGFASARILVVEDETLVAMLLEDMLQELGYEVVGPATHLDDAIARARDDAIDFAVLDVNLNGLSSDPVAEILKARGVPFAFATGYGVNGIPPGFEGSRVLSKPFTLAQLEKLLEQALA